MLSNTLSNSNSLRPKHFVGIGASAGGLEAIQAFFKHMPKDSGLAFIIIQHLSPDYKSLMSELVAKITDMPVHVAQDNMLVEANHIYLIPPKKNLKIFHGYLILTDQERTSAAINLPIDIFFTSLAEDQAEDAIGIILSGTGSDGTRGCRSIKEMGGMVMVQDEASAKFDGMPRSVIVNGLPDFVLDVEDMPNQLLAYIKHPYTARQQHKTPITGEKGSLAKIFSLLREKSKIDFTFYKPSTIVRRIERRMTVTQVDNLDNYVHYLIGHPQEQNTLFREMLIGVTSFFRDSDVFDSLAGNWLREALEKHEGEEFRIWIAGCSTGEEAYSYAILCAEILQQLELRPEIKIFATDIDVEAINKAGNGIFPESIAADIPQNYLVKYFVHRGDSYQIARQIREMVVFAKHNIIKDPPFTNISLISCRNLLIYLQPVLQQRVFNSFNFSLKKEGLLVLGSSESVGEAISFFEAIHNKYKIFKSLGNRKALISLGDYETPENITLSFPPRARRANDHFGIEENAVLSSFILGVVSDYIPCALIIDEEMHLLHVIGDASRYIQPFSGKVSTEIAKNIHKDLMIPVSTGLTKVFKKGVELGFSNVKLQQGPNNSIKVDIRIKPMTVKKGKPQLAAVVISDLNQPVKSNDSGALNYDIGKETEQRMIDLEQELQFTRENLQATIEELETSNEELQATNEELLASNEELQSTNEELQSVNEELFTVNSEFQGKILELTELNNDLDNFMNNADVIALFLDENMDIRKFTLNASTIFNVRDTDIGRPFKELKDHLVDFNLHAKTQQVNESNQHYKTEVQDDNGNWYYLRILPYLISHNVHSGQVIILNEINDLRNAQIRLLDESARQKLVYEKLSIGTWEWDIENDRLICSDDAIRMIGKQPATFKGKFDEFIQCLHPDDKILLETNLQVALLQNTHYDMPHRILLSNGEIRWLQFIGKPIKDHLGTQIRMIGIVRDISEQKSAQRDDQQWHKTTEMIFDSVGDGILGFDTRGELTFANHAAASLLGLESQKLDAQSLKPLLYLTDKPASACLDADCPVLSVQTDSAEKCAKLNCLIFDTLIAGNPFATDNGVLLTKNGQPINVAMIGSPIYNDGQLTGSVVVFRDLALSLFEQAERRLLETILNLSSQLIMLINESGNIIAWNPAAEHGLGYSQSEALNMTYLQLLPAAEQANMVGFFAEVKSQEGVSLTTACRHINKYGQEVPVWITAQALLSQNGRELRILCCETLNIPKP